MTRVSFVCAVVALPLCTAFATSLTPAITHSESHVQLPLSAVPFLTPTLAEAVETISLDAYDFTVGTDVKHTLHVSSIDLVNESFATVNAVGGDKLHIVDGRALFVRQIANLTLRKILDAYRLSENPCEYDDEIARMTTNLTATALDKPLETLVQPVCHGDVRCAAFATNKHAVQALKEEMQLVEPARRKLAVCGGICAAVFFVSATLGTAVVGRLIDLELEKRREEEEIRKMREAGGTSSQGNGDVMAVKMLGTKSTEVHTLSASSNYQSFSLHTSTALHKIGDPQNWAFGLKSNDDLVCIKQKGTKSTEVHILSRSSNYKRFSLHTSTALHKIGDPQNWAFLVH